VAIHPRSEITLRSTGISVTPIPPDIIDAALRTVEALSASGRHSVDEALYDAATWILLRHLGQARKVIEEAERKR
jgi:hypothetical protein